MNPQEEDDLLRSVALQNAQSILRARQRAEQQLVAANQALEHKSAELSYTLSMMRATLEATTDGILVTDRARNVVWFNATYLRMWSLPPDTARSQDHRDLLQSVSPQASDPEAFLQRIQAISTASEAETFDTIRLVDGREFERFSRIQMLNGMEIGRVWSFRDVTERRRAEAALREETRMLEMLNRTGSTLASNLELETIVQTVTDAATTLSGARFGALFYNTHDERGEVLTLYTLSGAPREQFEQFGQPRATALFGPTFHGEPPIRSDDVMNDPRYGLSSPHHGMPPGHLPVRSYLAVPVISRSGEVLGGVFLGHPEAAVFDARSERLVVGLAAQAAVAIDNARLFETTVRAADERKHLLESERAARSEAERMSGMKDVFLANLSHELRTPLSAILGWSQVLRRGAVAAADLQKGLETIERNARVQTRLIDDLLDVSRITSGKVRLDVQPVDPAAVVEAAIETVRPAADAKQIVISKLLDTSAGPVSGDPNRIQQIVWNLLSNALKFTPRGGKVRVVLERVNSSIEITVSDTGAGIAPAFLGQLFERFTQSDASTTRSHGGLGLGLSIAKHLVELHGGTIEARSKGEGAGATFVVRLPLAAVHRPMTDEPRAHPTAAKDPGAAFTTVDLTGLKVLVVDDEADARDLLRHVLGACNAEVRMAASALDALAAIAADSPDVLVSDIGMPGIDGLELLRRVRAARAHGEPPLKAIALTAFARSEDRTRALRAGFLAHVAKPVEPTELVATVASVAGRVSPPV